MTFNQFILIFLVCELTGFGGGFLVGRLHGSTDAIWRAVKKRKDGGYDAVTWDNQPTMKKGSGAKIIDIKNPLDEVEI